MPQAFGKFYLNVPAAAQLFAQSAQPALPGALLNSFQDSRGLAATMTLQSQGLQVASTSWFGPDSDRAYVDTNVPAQLPEYLPSDTLVMASGGNFQQFWQDLSDRRNWGALTALNPDNLALALQGSTGLTLEDDLLPWLAGEFALALMPPPNADSEAEETPTLPNPSLVVLAQVSDRLQAEQTFARLDEVVEDRYRFTLTDEPDEDVERVRWTSPFESTMLARGWLESTIAFLTVGPDTDGLIVALGGNDMLRGIDPAVSQANLAGILDAAQAGGLPVLLVGMESAGNYGPDYKAAFDGMYPALADAYGVRLFPSLLRPVAASRDGVGPLGPSLMQSDGTHPNRAGVALIVEARGPDVADLAEEIRNGT